MSQPPPHPAILRLVINGQVQPDAGFALSPSETILGRDLACDLVLSIYGGVSRCHALIRAERSLNPWIAQDLNSSNGTYLNGQRIQGQAVLSNRARIRLGIDGPEFQFEYASAQPSTPAIGTQHKITSKTINERCYRIEILP